MRFVTSAAALGFAALVLCGCVQQPPPVVPTSTPSVAPVFASDADALAAAKKAYTGYLAATDAVNRSGGSDLDALRPWATPTAVSSAVRTMADVNRAQEHIVGDLAFYNISLERVGLDAHGHTNVVIYVCLDARGTKILDEKGRDVRPTRVAVAPFEVTLLTTTSASELRVEGSEPWAGSDFC